MISFDDIRASVEKTVSAKAALAEFSGIWKKPLVACADADDKRFAALKEAVSPGHFLPSDILASARTVICFFIPFSDSVVKSNSTGAAASREWARAYIVTNTLIAEISEELARLLGEGGFKSGQIKATHNFDTERLVSDWSHRHAAYIAGMGTFGINNMLITDAGCCGRFGSLVTDWDEVSRNSVPPPAERCLYKRDGSCGICREKCPAGAYPDGMFDRHICYARCLENAALYAGMGLADVCGKCLCALPCSTKAPAVSG